MKLRIIGNPIAGGGKAAPRIKALTALLQGRGHSVEVQLTTKAGDAKAWAGELPEDLDRLIVAGGDGTLNEVLNGLVDPSRVPIVQMPVGTANVLVRELGLPWKPAGVAEIVESGRVRLVDMGEIRMVADEDTNQSASQSDVGPTLTRPLPGREGSLEQTSASWTRFLVVMSVGFDSMVIEDIHRNRKGKLGFFGYMKPIWRTIRRYTPPVITVRVDGQAMERGAMVVVANARNYAGLFTVAEKAAMDSGVLDVCVLPRGKVRSLVRFAWAAWRRKLSRVSGVQSLQGRSVMIESNTPMAVEVDGEYYGQTPVEVRIKPGVVPIVVPGE
ncbi:MAG: diacylglycerol kinase family protein [Phycisphaeraceae bacterium]